MAMPHNAFVAPARLAIALCATLGGVLLLAPAVHGKATEADRCLDAARHAARTTGAPLSVLRALALVESGHQRQGQFTAWPWTVNIEGQGLWFDTADAALTYISRHQDQGARSFDVGCFQINHRWHGDAFASLGAMLDPYENALYAARFLTGLYRETGDWSRAAGAYHSRSPDKARRYRKRFEQVLATLEPARVNAPEPAPQRSGRNPFPLLRASESRRGIGSLVPRVSGRRIVDLTGAGR